MLETLLLNFEKVFFAMALLCISYLSNMVFNLFYNIKINKEDFDYKKLLNGVFKLLSICVGTLLLSTAVTCFPLYLQGVGIPLPEDFTETFSIVAIVAMFIGSIYKYIKESFVTLKNILEYDGNQDV